MPWTKTGVSQKQSFSHSRCRRCVTSAIMPGIHRSRCCDEVAMTCYFRHNCRLTRRQTGSSSWLLS